ncbi:Mitochondrial acidic protein mam33 [Ceratocystis pirilliformis]|uniref:Mitochondrial acidic protein mam33 n=1 Tax=Ceratocystis pirilliformis TaxID=259994 RepID=A0ABR3YX09_9PEZI
MFALRSATRAAPRVLLRVPAMAGRMPVMATVSVALRSQRIANFSVSATLLQASETAQKLAKQLERELKFEDEASKQDQIPEPVTEFLQDSGFELVETPGMEEVKLVKKMGDEQITVMFSIADLGFNNPLLEDESFEEEEEESSAENEAKDENEIEEDEADNFMDPTPIRIQAVIEKPGKAPGAVSVDLTAQDGGLAIDSFFYFNKAAEAFASTAEVSHTRANVYAGPSFETLDEELQDKAEAYLNERGIDNSLATFVGDYANWKEQIEYVNWMKNLAGFMNS